MKKGRPVVLRLAPTQRQANQPCSDHAPILNKAIDVRAVPGFMVRFERLTVGLYR